MTGHSKAAGSHPLLAWFLSIILSLVWGSSFILIKKGLMSFNATEVGTLRIFSAGIFIIVAGVYLANYSSKPPKKQDIPPLIKK